MRTETTTRTLYTFAELSDKAKELALTNMRYTNTDAGSEWWDQTYEDAANVGIKITGFDTGRRNEITGEIFDTENTAHSIVRDHGEECETHRTAAQYLKNRDTTIAAAPKDTYTGEYTDIEALDDKLDELGKKFTKSILEDYLTILRNELEYLESDEAVQESIEANDYEFDEDGSLA